MIITLLILATKKIRSFTSVHKWNGCAHYHSVTNHTAPIVAAINWTAGTETTIGMFSNYAN